jgi:hypothetical protein
MQNLLITHPDPLFEKEREFLLFYKEEVRRSYYTL